MLRSRTLFFALCWLAPWTVCTALGQSKATYTVTFESTWSATTHPHEFPGNPHFSGLVGATHDASVSFWAVGAQPSIGIENMAETGGKFPLQTEIGQAQDTGQAGTLLSGGGIGRSPGSVSLTFETTEAHPLVTLVSMVAPSPDWFVGVTGLDLRPEGSWLSSVTDTLYVYDAGSDSGASYTSPNADTNPKSPIARIETPPFLVGMAVEPVGTFTFQLQQVVAVEDVPEHPAGLVLSAYPNPFQKDATAVISVPTRTYVTVAVYDLLGRRRAAPFAGWLPAGDHRVTFGDAAWPPGPYFVQVQTAHARQTRLLLRHP